MRALEEAILAQKPELDWHGPTTATEGLPGMDRAAIRAESVAGTDRNLSAGPPIEIASSAGGMVTFVFTDIEGSTALWERHPALMAATLEPGKPAVEEVSVDSGCHSSHRLNEVMHANRSRPGAEHAGV